MAFAQPKMKNHIVTEVENDKKKHETINTGFALSWYTI